MLFSLLFHLLFTLLNCVIFQNKKYMFILIVLIVLKLIEMTLFKENEVTTLSFWGSKSIKTWFYFFIKLRN